jgi:hypothetical protein
MKLRADFAKREHVSFANNPWTPSPEAGVQRKLLERDGEEVARASSIVRYAPDAAFPEHTHVLGEEFIMLEGVFSDECGDYPSASYVRNPAGSHHRPFSRAGCILFVKLRQFALADRRRCVIPLALSTAQTNRELLHELGDERVSLVRLARGASVELDDPGGFELLVLAGELEVNDEYCERWTWYRSPSTSARLRSECGATVWLKQGHLPRVVR